MRLDQMLVERELFASREKAKRAIMAGVVEVDGQRVDKAGTAVAADVEITVRGGREPFASRAGRKLAHALDHFQLDPAARVCMDVGASTGGFTDCLLQRGARRVYAVDVGFGQLEYRLRIDPRVVVMERVNARHLAADAVPEPCGAITIDVSFISLTKVVPALLPHLAADGWLLPMIKPQFEAGRASVGKGGIVRDPVVRRRVVADCVAAFESMGLTCHGVFESPVAGVGGNRESFAWLAHATGAPSAATTPPGDAS